VAIGTGTAIGPSCGSSASRRAFLARRHRSQYHTYRRRGPARSCPCRICRGPDNRLRPCRPRGADHFGGQSRCPRRRAP
jgi:hypothetical protein